MNSRGLLHFDAHFQNILTDGERLYFTDFGLAMSSQFELSDAESDFHQEHESYDRCYTTTHLVNWLVSSFFGNSTKDRDALLAECTESKKPPNLPKSAGAIIMRYAPIAVVMSEFFRKLQNESRTTPYPVEAIQRVCGTKGEPAS